MSPSYNYEADWRQYAFSEQDCRFTTEEEIATRYTSVDLTKIVEASGMPIISDGTHAVLNAENEHTMIFGGTASKKPYASHPNNPKSGAGPGIYDRDRYQRRTVQRILLP